MQLALEVRRPPPAAAAAAAARACERCMPHGGTGAAQADGQHCAPRSLWSAVQSWGPRGAALACGSCVADLEALLVGLARRCWAVACVLACIRTLPRRSTAPHAWDTAFDTAAPNSNAIALLPKGIH
jgi:hypothetical protein